MSRLVSFLTAHPSQQFRHNPRFYLAYDGFYAVLAVVLIATKLIVGFPALFGAPRITWLLALPVLLYAVVVAQLSVHNAVHGNFPRSINRILGEVLGVIVIVRFASWVMVHLRHHRFADDRELDPHPNFPSFWRTVLHTVIHVERQLMQEYLDQWGDTAENRAAEVFRAKVSYATNVLMIGAWLYYLGPWFFGLVFLPVNIFGGLFIIHFDWASHNGLRGEDFRPVNLNRGYFWLGNKMFAGIYMHRNHHDRPHLLNPSQWDTEKFGDQMPCADAAGGELDR